MVPRVQALSHDRHHRSLDGVYFPARSQNFDQVCIFESRVIGFVTHGLFSIESGMIKGPIRIALERNVSSENLTNVATINGFGQLFTERSELTKKATHPKLKVSVQQEREASSSSNSSGAIHLTFPTSRSDVELRAVAPCLISTALLRPKSISLATPLSSIRTLSCDNCESAVLCKDGCVDLQA